MRDFLHRGLLHFLTLDADDIIGEKGGETYVLRRVMHIGFEEKKDADTAQTVRFT